MSTFIKDVLSIGISKIAIIVLSLGSGIITARWLGPNGSGILATLVVYPSLFLTFGSLGISQSVTYLIGGKKYLEHEIKEAITQIWFFTSIFSVTICYLLIYYFTNIGDNILWVILSVLPIPFTLFIKYNSGIFLGKNQIIVYNKINWIPKLIVFLAIVILIIVYELGIVGALLASVLGPLFMFILLLFKNEFLRSFSIKPNWKLIYTMFSLGLVYAFALLIINLNYKIDIILLDKLSSPENTGIYAKGVSLSDFLWEIPMLLSTIVFARSSNSKNQIEFSLKVTQLLRVSIVAIAIGSIILYFLSEFIFINLYGIEFIKSATVFQLLLPGVLLLTFFKVLNMDLAGKGKPWISLKAMLPAVVINIFLNLLLIPEYNANGAAFSSTISYAFAAVLFLWFYSKEVNIPIGDILKYKRTDFDPILKLFK